MAIKFNLFVYVSGLDLEEICLRKRTADESEVTGESYEGSLERFQHPFEDVSVYLEENEETGHLKGDPRGST